MVRFRSLSDGVSLILLVVQRKPRPEQKAQKTVGYSCTHVRSNSVGATLVRPNLQRVELLSTQVADGNHTIGVISSRPAPHGPGLMV
jgi:hypothetical protein